MPASFPSPRLTTQGSASPVTRRAGDGEPELDECLFRTENHDAQLSGKRNSRAADRAESHRSGSPVRQILLGNCEAKPFPRRIDIAVLALRSRAFRIRRPIVARSFSSMSTLARPVGRIREEAGNWKPSGPDPWPGRPSD